ncbi:MAG: hypothetical protein WBG86_04200 [Polyangiales bacterium]
MISSVRVACALFAFALLTTSVGACARKIRPYSMEGPMWRDGGDFTPFLPMPESYYSPSKWDAADNMVFRPAARMFSFDPGGEAINVNSMDEVPDSSWYQNRLSTQRLSAERVARAACDESPLDVAGPWTITNAKPDGAKPGFIMKDQRGRSVVLKFDEELQPERPTAADVVGSILYWAAGYHAPCNEIVYFRKEILRIDPDATEKILGKEVPLTWERIEPMFEAIGAQPDGTYRGAASHFVPGKPLGPWRYDWVLADDPNDVVPHEDRRELRGAYVLASWIDHTDSREQNSLATWITVDERGGYVRHNYIDFGDSFGNLSVVPGVTERYGHTYFFDVPHIFQDFVTFGAIKRPWRDNELGPTGQVLAYYNVETFEPDKYRTSYQNPAFVRATERDKAWMTRIIARINPEILGAALDRARIRDPLVRSELTRIVFARREKILRRWFHKLSPLTEPKLRSTPGGTELCLEDLALATGIVPRNTRVYGGSAWRLTKRSKLRELETGKFRVGDGNLICVELPNMESASIEEPAYLIVDVIGLDGEADEHSRPARVHLYQVGEGGYLVVGLQRPYRLRAPSGRDQYYPRSLALVRLGED